MFTFVIIPVTEYDEKKKNKNTADDLRKYFVEKIIRYR